ICWKLDFCILTPTNFLSCLQGCLNHKNGSGVHVQNLQVCYIAIHVPWWLAAPINPSSTLEFSFDNV
uniref:Uncharacterized protein n=1 Tax=Macaca fascicularis TaxID=9541 RepID=A0A7N9DBD8_MACFA